jgi:hypothetical protein
MSFLSDILGNKIGFLAVGFRLSVIGLRLSDVGLGILSEDRNLKTEI